MQSPPARLIRAVLLFRLQANQHGIEDLPARLATKLKGDFLYVFVLLFAFR